MSAHPLSQPKHSSFFGKTPDDDSACRQTDQLFDVPLGGDFPLTLGGHLANATVSARLVGAENAPIVVVMGGISADRFVSDHSQRQGWWRDLAGDGKAIDTKHFRVLSFDFLAPQPNVDGVLPTISTRDQARVLARIMDHLSVSTVQAIIGSSYGAMVALAFGLVFKDRVKRLVAISGAHRTHPMTTALRSIQRKIVGLGLGVDKEKEALGLARQLAMTTYRSWDEFAERFDAPPVQGADGYHFAVEDYLEARGDDYAAKVSPQRFLALSMSLDMHTVDARHIKVPATFVAIREDLLVPLSDMRGLAKNYGGQCELVELSSTFGHDAFLKEADLMGAILRHNLSHDEEGQNV